MKTLKQILEVYSPKSADEKRFVNKHITIKHADRNGNGDDVFTASNVKTIDRAKEKKGHDAKASEAVYEGVVGKMLTDKGAKQLMAAPKGKKSYFKNTVKTDKGTETEHGYYDDQGNRHVTHKVAKEEVEQIDELTKSTLASYASKASKSAAGLATTAMHHKNAAAAWDNDNGRSASKRHANKMSKQFTQYSTDATNKQIKRQKGVDSALKRLAKEEIEVNEALKVSHGAGAWIKDFQDSDNPKFAGKSKEQRKQQALAAFYAAKRAGKE